MKPAPPRIIFQQYLVYTQIWFFLIPLSPFSTVKKQGMDADSVPPLLNPFQLKMDKSSKIL